MKSKMQIVLIALTGSLITVLLSFPAAHGTEVLNKGNGQSIPCKVDNLQTDSQSIGKNFNLKYEFCNGNRFTLQRSAMQYKLSNDEKVTYVYGPEAVDQACNKTLFTFHKDAKMKDYLRYATDGVQADVCNMRFKLTNMTP
ncbi:MAG: hypothetical protein CSYNP_04047 [Syntrophus sp. SKADARSKE-3]|nr:hypothetical protein [Syntrophus sp. SKADARSKE-3]